MKNSEATIKAPQNPNLLRLSQAIRDVDRRTKGSPANLMVPTALGDMLNKWGYGEKTSAMDKIMAAADVGGGPELAKLAPALGIFVGPSRLTDNKVLAEAARRLDAGDDAAKVWEDTGWGYHPTSGQLISEIDDSKMFLKERPMYAGDEMPLDDALSHPELSRAMSTKRMKLKTGVGKGGSWYGDTKTAVVGDKNLNTDDYKSVLLHELGHGASERFGFPGGSNMRHYAAQVEEALRKVNRSISTTSDAGEMAALQAQKDMIKKEANMTTQRYMDTSDEALQRLTQARAGYPASDRRRMYPFDPKYFKQNTSSNIEDLFNQEEYASKFLGIDDLLDVGRVDPEAIPTELMDAYRKLINRKGFPEEGYDDTIDDLLDSANDDPRFAGYTDDSERLFDNAASRMAQGSFSLQDFNRDFPSGMSPDQKLRFDARVEELKKIFGPQEPPPK